MSLQFKFHESTKKLSLQLWANITMAQKPHESTKGFSVLYIHPCSALWAEQEYISIETLPLSLIVGPYAHNSELS